MPSIITSIRSLCRARRGTTAVEYALILAVIALGISTSLSQITGALVSCFDTIASYLLVTR